MLQEGSIMPLPFNLPKESSVPYQKYSQFCENTSEYTENGIRGSWLVL